MPSLCPPPSGYARKSCQNILHRLALVGLTPVAQAMGKSESTISRMKDTEIPELAAMLDALGLKVVPRELKCYDEKTMAALLQLAKERMNQCSTTQQLEWDDEITT